ncbi:MAG: DUF4350 domain-containing protein [Pseudomonadota bacterium]
MSDRLVTFLGACAALLIFIALIYQPQSAPPASKPLSKEAGAAGYLALRQWLDLEQVNALAARTRVSRWIDDDTITEQGNLLLTTLPQKHPFTIDELDALHAWVAQGNTLLVMAALDNTPTWSLQVNDSSFLSQFEELTDLRLSAAVDENDDTINIGGFFDETPVFFSPVQAHPLMSGVGRLESISDSVTAIWQLEPDPDDYFVARLATEESSGVGAVWEVPWGKGQILVSASSNLFSNRMLGKSDNARFISNIIRYHLSANGTFIFDDMHQGDSDIYDADAFFGDERLLYSMLFILAFWLIYLVGTSKRIAPPLRPERFPQQSDVVTAAAAFMSRKLTKVDAGRLMIDQWLRELHARGLLIPGANPWDQLDALTVSDKLPLQSLREAQAQLNEGKAVDLTELNNNLYFMRRAME